MSLKLITQFTLRHNHCMNLNYYVSILICKIFIFSLLPACVLKCVVFNIKWRFLPSLLEYCTKIKLYIYITFYTFSIHVIYDF